MNRILFLDDDDKFRRLVVPQLKERGFDVIQARNAQEASDELACCAFDLLIVDGQLPDLDGATWLKAMRERGIKTEALFVSASWRDSENYQRLIEELDVALIVHKPLNVRVFIEQIMQVFRISVEPTALPFQFNNDAEMQELANDYVVDLNSKLVELEMQIAKVEFCRDVIALNKAHLLAHNIHGTAATYGFPSVGSLLAEAENQLQSIKSETTCIRPERFAALRALLKRAATECQCHLVSARNVPLGALSRKTVGEKLTKIMLVDDDPFFLRRAQQLLAADGMVITSFTDTARIGDVIAEVCPDVIILDVNMAGVSGFDVCRFLKANIRWRDLPIIVVSAEASAQRRITAMEAGADDFIAKPINNLTFARLVDAQVKRRDSLISRLAT